ncbi:SDR family oxidoreductase [Wielerella bovis]|uniref:SDR family oxidoreductase n=1 Tax=Wielerella bovis TaxID=2917790 RepID=UPI00201A1C82|nr:SDR family oxidoreductase [Wielerella bovis]ULJ60182.1 SDR family oxidoreductase [Wielerella bovis]
MAILITGASAGFGAAMCRAFVQAGYPVIGAARRLDKLTALQEELGFFFQPLEMDVADKQSVDLALKHLETLPEKFQQIDCLINNAGLALGLEPAHEANMEDWETMIHTNILGLTYLTRQVLPQMVERSEGYVMNLGSIAGTYPYPGGNVYGATKAFVRQFSLNLRADLQGKGVRVSNIEPGLCGGTEFSNVRFKGDDERAAKLYENVDSIQAEDIARTALWLYQCPKHMNINAIEIMPVAQAFGALPVTRKTQPENVVQTTQTAVSSEGQQGFFSKLASLFK